MGDILLRIQEIATNEGINITSMERVIGASKGVLSRAIKQGTDIQSKWLKAIVENYPLYSATWLLTGEGSMFREERSAGIIHEDPQVPTPKPDDSILYNMYKDLQEEKKRVEEEKEKKIEQLTNELRAMERKVGKLEAELKHAATLCDRTADSVSTKKHSSQSKVSAHSASAPLNE